MELKSPPPNDASMPEGLTIEGFAHVLAHTQHFGRHSLAEVLLRLGLDDVHWEVASRGWATALADESSIGATHLATRFGSTFGATLARLKATQPSLTSLGPLPIEGSPRGASAAVEETPSVRPRFERPTYLRGTVRPETLKPDSIDPNLVPPGLRGVTDPRGTAPVDPRAASQPVLPFDASAVPTITPRLKGSAERHLMGVLLGGETQDVSTVVASMVARGEIPGLPWSSSPQPEKATATPPQVSDADRTSAEAKVPVEDVSTHRRELDLGPPISEAPGRLPISATTLMEIAVAASPPVPALTVEQYASLCVEVGLWPAESESILARYGITAAQRTLLDEHWKSRMQADVALRNAWRQAFDTYGDWILSQPRRTP